MSRASSPSPHFAPPLDPANLPTDRCPVPRDEAQTRILILRAGGLGDILMGTPLLAALRRAYPAAFITWAAEHTQAEAIDANPYVDEILYWNSRYWKQMIRKVQYPLWLARALQFRGELQRRHFDTFVSFQPEEWPLLARNCGAATRVGVFDTFARFYQARRTSRNTSLYTHAYTRDDLPLHRTDQYLLTLRALGLSEGDIPRATTLGFTGEDSAAADRLLTDSGIDPAGEPFAILVPRTTWTTKCWPAGHFAELGDRLADSGLRIVLTGSPSERQDVEAVAARMKTRPAVLAGEMRFRQLAALIAKARLLVSGDTGPMHAAAALGTPYVALFGSTSADWYGPLGGGGIHLSHAVPCGPCDRKTCGQIGDGFEHCMRLITVDEAYAAANRLLAARAFTPLILARTA